MEFDKDAILKKFSDIKEKYVDTYEPDINIERGRTAYLKDVYDLDNNKSKFITPHIHRGKMLFKKEHKSLPKNAIKEEYYEVVYDKDGNLHHLEVNVGQPSFLADHFEGANGGKAADFIVSPNLRIDYSINLKDGVPCSHFWTDFEWTEYDEEGRIISVEKFTNDHLSDGDFVLNAEYYTYENGILTRIDRFEDFHSRLPENTQRILQINMPDRLYNPTHFEYTFSKEGTDLVWTRTCFFRKSQTLTVSGKISEAELKKLKDIGIHLI